ncbi:putative Xaa-Pro aminopeptidase pepP [Exophiala dermatitidis]
MSATDTTLKGKYPAKAHCRRVAKYLTDAGLARDGVIYLEAQKTRMVEDDDQAVPFRQRRYFFYLSGCRLPDAYLTYNIPQDILTLFIPPVDPDSVIWAGLPESKEEALQKYDVDQVLYSDEVNAALAAYGTPQSKTTVYAIPEQVSEHITFLPFAATDFEHLKTAIDECRVIKDSYEVALMRKANQISTLAHIEAAKVVRTATNEQELYGAFIGTCISNGAHEQAYHSICASGTSCSTLHYIRNDQPLRERLNILLDAGAEYNCYCADITRTFPISGTFTPESQTIYNIVDEMQSSCFKLLRANVRWEDVHEHAHWVAIRGLKKAGILVGNEQEIFDKRISVAFFPHGLGHYLGMDTHDTGGHANYDDPDTMFKYLRVRGNVPAGAVITVEPGIYFCKFILDPVLEDPKLSKYIDKTVLDRYWAVGGVRIEDDIHITEDGYENLTDTPKL